MHRLYDHPRTSSAMRRQIRDMIIRMATWWSDKNFSTNYYGRYFTWGGSHPTAVFLYLMALAHRLSRRKIFDLWYDLLAERRHQMFRDVSYCSGNAGNMILRSMLRLMRLRPADATTWRRTARVNGRLCMRTVHETGYAVQNPPYDDPKRYGLLGVSTLVADTDCCAREVLSPTRCLTRAQSVLKKTGAEGHVAYYRLMGGRPPKRTKLYGCLSASLDIYAKKISGYYTAGWLLAYWHMRRLIGR
jgi:hypothetical protein